MKNYTLVFFFLSIKMVSAQVDSSLLVKRIAVDTSAKMNMDAVYQRPFLQVRNLPLSFGGYVEMKGEHLGTDGVSEGLSFSFQRMTLFVASTISDRFRFLSEVELEEGGREINIEFASVDWEVHSLFNIRGGIIMNPIGAFNQNHDAPKWEFVDRPISATQMLPATWSNVGAGFFGKYSSENWIYGYEAYLTNGFDDRIVSNEQNKTFLPASKDNIERFEESFNGIPLVTTKIAVRHRRIAEVGISYMGGVYNKYQDDGIKVDEKRRTDVFAIDISSILPVTKTNITAEWAWVWINIPDTYSQQFGSKQYGGFADFVQPVIKKKMLGCKDAVLNIAFRFEYVDWNVGTFIETGGNISDDLFAVVPAISLRPSAQTVLRLNYRYQWQQDLLGNPPAKTAGIQVGFASYF